MENVVCVKVSGLNLPRLINKLISKNVFVNNVVYKNNTVRFFINEKQLPILNKICKTERKFYTIISRNGSKKILYRLKYLFGAILATLIIGAYMFSNCIYVRDVKVLCDSDLPCDLVKIENILLQNNIKIGMFKRDINTKEIENILLSIDEVSGCSIKRIGSDLIINIVPVTRRFEPQKENIVSKYDAVITRAETYAGIQKVKVGDFVKKDDLLIENNNGAQGKIYGKVYFTATKLYNQNKQKQLFTGRYFRKREYSIFKKTITKSAKTHDFTTYLAENCSFYVWNNCFVPLICNETIFYETEIVDYVVPFESVEKEVLKECYNEALKQIENADGILNVTYSVVSEGALTRVDCFIETEILLFWAY